MPGHFVEPPPPPKPGPRRPVESHRDHRLKQDRKPWNAHLESAGVNVPAHFLTESRAAAELVAEDLCWQAAMQDWKQRKPCWWRSGARAAWKAEGIDLADWAERLRKMADYISQEL
jgi:hypothetical protein